MSALRERLDAMQTRLDELELRVEELEDEANPDDEDEDEALTPDGLVVFNTAIADLEKRLDRRVVGALGKLEEIRNMTHTWSQTSARLEVAVRESLAPDRKASERVAHLAARMEEMTTRFIEAVDARSRIAHNVRNAVLPGEDNQVVRPLLNRIADAIERKAF